MPKQHCPNSVTKSGNGANDFFRHVDYRCGIMLANYGYSDGSGDYFITIDTQKCDACGACVVACPSNVLVTVDEDPNDPENEGPVVVAHAESVRKLRYECDPCKSATNQAMPPCVAACKASAIWHSW